MEDVLQWTIAIACFVVTIAVKAEVAVLFVVSGLVGILYYGSLFRGRLAPSSAAMVTVSAGASKAGNASLLGKLLLFFLKAGSLTFGSGLVILPFLEKGLVQNTDWLNERQFLVAVAIGMISPGPVVITATFVG
jgi:chromate transporter